MGTAAPPASRLLAVKLQLPQLRHLVEQQQARAIMKIEILLNAVEILLNLNAVLYKLYFIIQYFFK